MAPRKRKTEGEEKAKPETISTRVTRSSTRRANANSTDSASELAWPELPKKKKAKAVQKKGKGKENEELKTEEEVKETETDTENTEEKETETEEIGGDGSNKKTVVIEHCKQCNSFLRQALKVKNGLEKGVPGITVVLNPEKPRRGCFEIREEGGELFISLLDLKRPFTSMKQLDMEKVISDIIDKIN